MPMPALEQFGRMVYQLCVDRERLVRNRVPVDSIVYVVRNGKENGRFDRLGAAFARLNHAISTCEDVFSVCSLKDELHYDIHVLDGRNRRAVAALLAEVAINDDCTIAFDPSQGDTDEADLEQCQLILSARIALETNEAAYERL